MDATPPRTASRAAGSGLVLAILLGLSGLSGCARPAADPFAGAVIVDLSHAFGDDTIFWPTETEGFVLEPVFHGRTEGGWWYEANRFRTAEHGGTHLDAPVHFGEGGHAVDAIPVAQLAGPAVRVDVSAACAADPDHALTVAELAAFEAVHGRIPDGALVLIYTGWSRFWPDRARYLGTEERGPAATAALRFPGVSAGAARWLAEQRRVRAVGIDTASIDPGVSTRFEAHQALAAAGVPGLENLTGLDRLPARGFSVVALPMKIRGGSGAPLRAIAIVPAPDTR
ncbi:MAG: cyclase family protein [Deltaproteobacteria bacterium]|nr:cyclase family protein [Deltaproteobacteria bacterium]